MAKRDKSTYGFDLGGVTYANVTWVDVEMATVTKEQSVLTSPPKEKKTSRPPIKWEDIAGCNEAIQALREAIEFPAQHAELFAAYGQVPSRGVLLYGPPGNGKTLIARAAATALGVVVEDRQPERSDYGNWTAPRPAVKGWHYVKGSELLRPYVGQSEELIKKMFSECRAYKAATGKQAVIFIDEADAILGVRGRDSFSATHLVPTFLAELDGLDDSGAFVLLASNRPDSIDPAILRDGRIDRRILVGRPSRATARVLLANELGKRPLATGAGDAVSALLDAIYSPSLALWELRYIDGSGVRVCFGDAISGAMLVGLVNRATGLAFDRDRKALLAKPSGVTVDDLRAAVWAAHVELVRSGGLEVAREKAEASGQPVALALRAEYATLEVPCEPTFREVMRAEAPKVEKPLFN